MILIKIFKIFQARKIAFWGTLFGLFALGLWGLSQVKVQTDISSLLVGPESGKVVREILAHHPLQKRILFFAEAAGDTPPDPSYLASAVEAAWAREDSALWLRLEVRQSEAELDSLRKRVLQWLPWILTPDEICRAGEKWVRTDAWEAQLDRIFHLLLSPGARFLQKDLTEDPLGLSALWFQKLETLSGSTYAYTPEGVLTDASGRRLLGALVSRRPAEDVRHGAALMEAMDRVKARLQAQGIRFGFFGAPLMAAENAERIKKDVQITMGLTLLGILLLLAFGFRSWHFLPTLLVTLAGGAAGASLAAALATPHVPALSLGLAAVFVGISVDYALHLLVSRAAGATPEEILKKVAPPMLLSMLTTVASFAVLTFTRSPVTRAFGWMAAGGILGACLAALLWAPHFLEGQKKVTSAHWGLKVPPKALFVLRIFLVFITVCALYFYRTPPLDSDVEKLSYTPPDLAADQAILDEAAGVSLRNILLVSSDEDEKKWFDETARVGTMLAESQALEPGGSWLSYTRLFPDPELRRRSAIVWDSVFSPDRRRVAYEILKKRAEKEGFRAEAFASFFFQPSASERQAPSASDLMGILPRGLRDLFVCAPSGAPPRFVGVLRVPESRYDDVKKQLERGSADLTIVDRKSFTQSGFEFLEKDFGQVVGGSLLVVVVLLLLGFGRIELAILALLPLALSWVWVGALMHLGGLSFNFVSLIVCSFIFGLGVDYSVFYLHREMRACSAGERPDAATARAVFFSAATTLLATGGLMFSRHPALNSVGLLSVAGLGAVGLFSAFLTPAIFGWLVKKPLEKGYKLHTLKNLLSTLVVWLGVLLPFAGAVALALPVSLLLVGRKKWIQSFFRHYIWMWARLYINLVFLGRRRYVCWREADFRRPHLVFANHQSFIDTALIFSLSPRLIIGTKNSIYNHPVFGPVSRLCGYINVSLGHEKYKPRLIKELQAGRSFALFPEGTRSPDFKIHRFHSGLFDLALSTGKPLMPVLFVGTGHLLPKGAFWGSRQHLIMEVGPPVVPEPDTEPGAARRLAHRMAAALRRRYEEVARAWAGGPVAADWVRHRFLYINPWLVPYIRLKLRLENYYESFHRRIPSDAHIVELGCGLGLIGHMLTCYFPSRSYTGFDWDEEKIRLARSRRSPLQDKVVFEHANILHVEPQPCEALIVSDVLHYLPPEAQWPLMDRWTERLPSGALLFLRDGLSDMPSGHGLTRLSEFFSTRLTVFNKAAAGLHFLKNSDVENFCVRHNLEILEEHQQRRTSNRLWIFRKP